MIIGVGVDIVDNARMKSCGAQSCCLQKILTSNELDQLDVDTSSNRFIQSLGAQCS